VSACEECQVELAGLQRVHAMLREVGTAPRPPERLRRRVLSGTGRPATPAPDVYRWRLAAVMLGAVAIALVAVLCLQLIAG
jgi:hypothetical protein